MQALPPGTHSRSMLLCKVAKGKVFRTERNMDTLTQPPDGFHSVHGVATEDGDLNYDELVVYDEAAILPCAALSVPPCGWRCPCRPTLFRCPLRSLSFAVPDSCRNFPSDSAPLALVASRRLTGRVLAAAAGSR